MKLLLVGDPHATPEELSDCERLFDLVAETAERVRPDAVVCMGDLHNNHDAMSVRVMDFYKRQHARLLEIVPQVVAIKGNHDQSSPTDMHPHALQAYPEVTVVDHPTTIGGTVDMMPYYADHEAFLRNESVFYDLRHDKVTGPTVLLCHGTFEGSRFENGFYAPEGIDPRRLKHKFIISGHIHLPQEFGNVLYIGAPRWRTKSDANIDRFLWVVEVRDDWTGYDVLEKVPTDTHCRRRWALTDRPEAEADLSAVPAERWGRDDVLVEVYGPADRVRARVAEFAARGARTRAFPDRVRRSTASESDGVDKAFDTFLEGFEPPNGTARDALRAEVRRRLEAASGAA